MRKSRKGIGRKLKIRSLKNEELMECEDDTIRLTVGGCSASKSHPGYGITIFYPVLTFPCFLHLYLSYSFGLKFAKEQRSDQEIKGIASAKLTQPHPVESQDIAMRNPLKQTET